MFGGYLDKFTSELPSSVKVSATGLLKRRRPLALNSKNAFSNDALQSTLRGWRILHLRPAGRHQDSYPDQDDHADGNPHRRNIEQKRGDAQPENQDDEADQVRTEC